MWRMIRHFFGKHYIDKDDNTDIFYCVLCHRDFTFDEILKMAKREKKENTNGIN